jgi:uncharacterized protein (DUF427 family)
MDAKRIVPGPGQESVWDYPRPPRIEPSTKTIQVFFNGVMIAETRKARRVLETSHPPTFYIPPDDVKLEYLQATSRKTFCEWKGRACYYSIKVGEMQVVDAAWYYPRPTTAFSSIKKHLAFYPSKMEACYVEGERVQAQAGDFYGGWITKDVVGPFKGESGTWVW